VNVGRDVADADTVELAHLLELLRDWLATDRGHHSDSLERLVGSPAYGIATLRVDLANFAFLLGSNDGEHLIDPDANSPEF
jgi:hypothetical protein